MVLIHANLSISSQRRAVDGCRRCHPLFVYARFATLKSETAQHTQLLFAQADAATDRLFIDCWREDKQKGGSLNERLPPFLSDRCRGTYRVDTDIVRPGSDGVAACCEPVVAPLSGLMRLSLVGNTRRYPHCPD